MSGFAPGAWTHYPHQEKKKEHCTVCIESPSLSNMAKKNARYDKTHSKTIHFDLNNSCFLLLHLFCITFRPISLRIPWSGSVALARYDFLIVSHSEFTGRGGLF